MSLIDAADVVIIGAGAAGTVRLAACTAAD
jgi:siroheme synthase (precorrin-2 oxidase/ferrochelatase)